MRYSTQIKPISSIKSHAAEVMDGLSDEREPIVITQNGEARAVLVDVRTYEETEERLALLQILALGEKQMQSGEVFPVEEAVSQLRSRLSARFGAVSTSVPAKE
jgi:prevent-host-death family protein